ncbi:hypothetical protein IMSAGC006_02155 [Muribaculaceae bacterium]|nr:hypothetical protein IMSAGC006_02155 [Muribaculaceae bacterium]
MPVVVIGVGAGSDGRCHAGGVLVQHEPGLQEHFVRIVLVKHLHQIVARHGRPHIFVGHCQRVVYVVGQSGFRQCVVVDVGLVESVEIFRFHKLARPPVGIAVQQSVSQIPRFFSHFVKLHDDPVWSVHIDHRRCQRIALDSHLQGFESGSEYAVGSVGCVQGHRTEQTEGRQITPPHPCRIYGCGEWSQRLESADCRTWLRVLSAGGIRLCRR